MSTRKERVVSLMNGLKELYPSIARLPISFGEFTPQHHDTINKYYSLVLDYINIGEAHGLHDSHVYNENGEKVFFRFAYFPESEVLGEVATSTITYNRKVNEVVFARDKHTRRVGYQFLTKPGLNAAEIVNISGEVAISSAIYKLQEQR